MQTILVVEDDQILLETLCYNFERAGFMVESASDGIKGLELARRRPHLIILDIMLPGVDGFTICRTIAKESPIPIILLTALHDEAHLIAGLELGAIDYVVKPFRMGELLAVHHRDLVRRRRLQHRGRGAGTRLLAELLDEGARAGRRVSVHVEKHNPALRLYERLGFLPAADKGVYLLMEAKP